MISRNKVLFLFGYILLLSMILLKVLAASQVGLFEDEALYWNWSHQIDPSYSVTTLLAIKASTTILNSNEELIVRLPAIIIGLVLPVLIYKTGKLLGSNSRKILIATLFIMSVPFVSAYTFSIVPDSLLLLSVSLSVYFALRIIKYDAITDWILSGLSVGLAILSKYQGLVFAVAFILFFVLSRKKTGNFSNKLMLFAATAAAVVSPMLIWNLINEPVWLQHYLFTDVSVEDESLATKSLTFLLGQISILMPFALLMIIGISGVMLKSFSTLNRFQKFLLFTGLSVLLVFSLLGIFGKIKGNWSFIAYVPLSFLLLTIELKKTMNFLFAGTLAFNLLFLIALNLPVETIKKFSSSTPGKLINSTFLYYWPEAQTLKNADRSWSERIIKMKNNNLEFSSIENRISDSGHNYDFIACRDFNMAGLIKYYFKGHPEVYITGDARFRYLNSLEKQIQLAGKDAMVISDTEHSELFIPTGFEEIKQLTNQYGFEEEQLIFFCRRFHPGVGVNMRLDGRTF